MTNNNKLATKQHNKNAFKDVPLEKRPKITVYPRSKSNLFDKNSNELIDLLPDFQPNLFFAYKNFELRFYVDIAKQVNGVYMGHRKLTAQVRDQEGKPLSDKAIAWSRKSGSNKLRFLDASNNLKVELSGANAAKTDSDGLVEVTIVHPAEKVNPGDENLVIDAKVDGSAYEIRLTITRNNNVTNLDAISRKNLSSAEYILVYQPIQNQRSASNQAVEGIQEVCNEVISRHRGIPSTGANKWDWIPLDGIYGDETKKAIKQYLNTFNNVQRGADYQYDLSNINLSKHLKNYLKTEYLFDPETDDNKGKIIDRHLLLGSTWDITPANIDGLLELKEGVVDRLKDEMVNMANTYINCNTFWLHKSIHLPYQQSPNWVFRIINNNINVKAAPNPQSPNLMDAGGNAIIVNAGELFSSPNFAGVWTQISLPGVGNGWVLSNSGHRINDDQSIARNSGIHGGNGVAYSFGCKDLVAIFTSQLNSNPNAIPNDAGGNRHRIASWDEYDDQHRVGRTSAETAWAGVNQIPFHTGCDCSGFTQNCITGVRFFNGLRIVPEGITRQIVINANRVPQNYIGSGSFVGNHARLVTGPQNNAQQHWMRQGDVIAGGGHIVWVAEVRPNALNNNNAFEVFNEYGNFRYYLPNGLLAPLDSNRFLRKALRMPFHYWRRTLNGLSIGKVYIWR